MKKKKFVHKVKVRKNQYENGRNKTKRKRNTHTHFIPSFCLSLNVKRKIVHSFSLLSTREEITLKISSLKEQNFNFRKYSRFS